MDKLLYPVLGKRLFDAYESSIPVGAFSLEYPDIQIEDAYAIQMELKKCHEAAGRHVIGRKIGLTSKGMRRQANLDQPDYGFLFAEAQYFNGHTVPYGKSIIPRVLLCRTKGVAHDDVLAKEKLCPVLALFEYDTWEGAVEIARANLSMEGAGHSCIIHSNTKKHIEYVSTRVNVSRYGVNQVGGTGLGGAMDNGLNPTTTLGCGTWGGNSISENIYFHNLMNVSRISYRIKDRKIPTDEEIWA